MNSAIFDNQKAINNSQKMAYFQNEPTLMVESNRLSQNQNQSSQKIKKKKNQSKNVQLIEYNISKQQSLFVIFVLFYFFENSFQIVWNEESKRNKKK